MQSSIYLPVDDGGNDLVIVAAVVVGFWGSDNSSGGKICVVVPLDLDAMVVVVIKMCRDCHHRSVKAVIGITTIKQYRHRYQDRHYHHQSYHHQA